MDLLRVVFAHDEDLVVGAPLGAPAHRLTSACLVRGASGPRLEIHYDEAANIVYVFVGGAVGEWVDERRTEWASWQDDPDRAPARLRCDTATATLQFTDDPGMYLFEPGEARPSDRAAWNGVAVDLTNGVTPKGHWGDYDPTCNCHEVCQDDETKAHFAMCIDDAGQINGILIEAPADDLPQPRNAALRARSSGRWPDLV